MALIEQRIKSLKYDQLAVRKKENVPAIFFLLVIFSILAVVLSSVFFEPLSLRLDEAQSLWQSSHNTDRILRIVAGDVHVPLYHLILHYWQFLFGNGVPEARFLSLIFFIGMIFGIYFLGKEAFNSSIGIFAAFLASISPFLLWYASEIRMYTLLGFMIILNQYAFVRLIKSRGGAGWFAYALSGIIGIYIHYFFWLNLLTQAIFFLFRRDLFGEKSLRKFIVIFAAIGLSFSPWIFYVLRAQEFSNSQPFLSPPSSVNLFIVFVQFLFGFHNDLMTTIILAFWPLAVLGFFLLLRRGIHIPNESYYFVLAAFLPVIAVFAVSLFWTPLFLTRYLIVTLPAFYLVLSWAFSVYPRSFENFIKIALVVLMVFMLGDQVFGKTVPVKEDYQKAASYIEDMADPQDIIIISAPFTVYPFEYYYRGSVKYLTLPFWDRLIRGRIPPYDKDRLPQEVNEAVSNHKQAWVILSYDQGYEEDVRSYFDTNYDRNNFKEFSPGLAVYGYRIRYDMPELATSR